MGNENSSMCTCYDNEAERLHAESNIYKNRLPARGNGGRYNLRNDTVSQRSQYSTNKGGPRSANSVSPHSQTTFRNRDTFTSTKKSNLHSNYDPGSMTSRYDQRGPNMGMGSQHGPNSYGKPMPQGQFMDEDAW